MLNPISARPLEDEGECQFWTAEFEDGHVAMFRSFANKYPTTPEERWEDLKKSYNLSKFNQDTLILKDYERDLAKGAVLVMPATQLEWSRFLKHGEPISYRAATGCEVAAWCGSHVDELLALEDVNSFIETLKTFVPDELVQRLLVLRDGPAEAEEEAGDEDDRNSA